MQTEYPQSNLRCSHPFGMLISVQKEHSTKKLGKEFMKSHLKKSIKLALILSSLTTLAIDNPHFYRATYFWGEPRFETPWLTSFDVSLGGATTRSSRNGKGEKTDLLNIFGPHNMQCLGKGVPNLDPTNPLDQILIDLAALPTRKGFGQLQFAGKFRIQEATFNLYQNLINGFYLQAYLPARKLKISQVAFTDLSPCDRTMPNKNTPEWQAFLAEFPAILSRYGLSLDGANRAGLGDLTILGGWSQNYQNTDTLDFVDIDAKIGILFPTGARRNIHESFDLAQGYDGHWGVPLKFAMAIGALEWFNLGVHLGALFFMNKTRNRRLKTSINQNGFIKLATGEVEIDKGTIWDFGTYIKADHFVKGLSILLGYSYNKKDADCMEPKDTTTFDSCIINSDREYQSWRIHTFHFLIEYDFAQKPSDIGPRIGFFYNRVVGGRRVFNANMKAAYCGIDLSWCY